MELSGLVLLIEPQLIARFADEVPESLVMAVGAAMLALTSLYVLGSWMHLKPFRIGSFQLTYPRLPIVMRQLVIGPLELIGAAGIIYFALPGEGGPSFLIVLGIFLASYVAALLSHAPGGPGVLEIGFVTGLPDFAPADVLAALIVFRLFYLLIPFAASLLLILLFERAEFRLPQARRRAAEFEQRRMSQIRLIVQKRGVRGTKRRQVTQKCVTLSDLR